METVAIAIIFAALIMLPLVFVNWEGRPMNLIRQFYTPPNVSLSKIMQTVHKEKIPTVVHLHSVKDECTDECIFYYSITHHEGE